MITFPVPSDGNCLFSSLASFFNRPDINHVVLRRMIVHYIVQNADTFADDIAAEGFKNVDDYASHMSQVGQWGDSIVISAFTMLFNVNVCISFSESPNDNPTVLSDIADVPTVALLLTNNHYSRILACGFCKKCEAFTLDELAAFCVALRIPMSKHDSKEMLCKRIFTKLSPEERNAFNSIYQALQNGSAPPTASTPMTSSPPLTRQRQQEQVASTVAPFLFTEVPKRLVQQQARNKRYHPVIIGDANRPFPPASMPYFIAKTADSPSYPVEEAKDMLLANLEKMYEKLAPFVNLGFMSNGEFKTVKVTFLRSLFEKANADDLQRGIAMHFKSNDGTIRGLVNFRLVEAVAPPAPVKVKAAPPVVNEEDKLMAEILGRVVLADKVAAKKKEQKPVARLQKGQHKPGPLPKAEYPFWTNVNVISDGTGRVVITHENEPFETLTGVTAIYTEAYTDEKNEKRRGIVIQQSGDRVVYVGWFEPSHFDVYHFNLVPGEEVKALFYNPKPQSAFEKDDPNSESKYLEIPALFGQTHVYFPTYGTFITIQDWTTKYIVDRDNIRKLARLAQPVTITKRNNPRI